MLNQPNAFSANLTTPSKRCFRCSVLLSISEFYSHPQMADGHLGKCKACTKNDVRQNYMCSREAKGHAQRNRDATPHRRAYRKDAARRHRLLHPDRYAARTAVSNALRSGKLVKQSCGMCGTVDNVQAHHPDYSKPLDVLWRCFKCHREEEHGQTVT